MAGLSLPYADVGADGSVVLRKLPQSGGELSSRTCTQQLIYEIGDPEQYFTPDVIANFSNVRFKQISQACLVPYARSYTTLHCTAIYSRTRTRVS